MKAALVNGKRNVTRRKRQPGSSQDATFIRFSTTGTESERDMGCSDGNKRLEGILKNQALSFVQLKFQADTKSFMFIVKMYNLLR